MGTVLIDRYRVRCKACRQTQTFIVGGGMGDEHAFQEARRRHQESKCGRALCRADVVKVPAGRRP